LYVSSLGILEKSYSSLSFHDNICSTTGQNILIVSPISAADLLVITSICQAVLLTLSHQLI
jgi:hypothetical protein